MGKKQTSVRNNNAKKPRKKSTRVVGGPGVVLTAYCDGSSKKDGRGGWGLVIFGTKVGSRESVVLYGPSVGPTTNNRMELMAAIKCLSAVVSGSEITVHSDSAYVVNGASKWLEGWKTKHWLTATGKQPVLNSDLWKRLDRQIKRVGDGVRWQWVKGHSGDIGNTVADSLANLGASQCVV